MYGAPNRIVFDQILTPNNEEGKISQLLGTEFVNGKLKYQLYKQKGYFLPPLWNNFNDSLLDNMIIIRGIAPRVNGHPECNIQTVLPRGAVESVHGRVSQKTKGFYPVIQLGNTPAIRSFLSKRKQPVNLNVPKKTSDTILMLESVLRSKDASDLEKKISRTKLLRDVLKTLKKELSHNDYENLKSAVDFMDRDFEKILSEYKSIEKKYLKIVKRQKNSQIKDSTSFDLSSLRGKIKDKKESLAKLKIDDNLYFGSNNIADIYLKANYEYVAREFALVELFIKHKISTNILVSSNNEMGALVENPNLERSFMIDKKSLQPRKAKNIKNYIVSMDSHRVGPIVELALSTKYFQCFVGCLGELKDFLVKESLFDRTLINVTSEFNRLPRDDYEGSEHNEKCATTLFVSGKINKLEVIGNIYLGSKGEEITGVADKVSEIKREVESKDVIRTICDFFQVEAPAPRTFSLLDWEKKTKSKIGQPKTRFV